MTWRTAPAFAAGVLATLAAALVLRFRGPARADSARTDQVLRWWADMWLRAAGARVSVRGLEHVEPATCYVVVSNHQSYLDPMADLRVLPLSLRILAMRELFRIPLLGSALRTAGMIEVDRDAPDLARIDKAAVRSLAAGHSLLVYPEGRLSPDGSVGVFKDGAFILAAARRTPVLPVAIQGTRTIWLPGGHTIRAGEVRIAVGRPLPARGASQQDIAGLRDRAQAVIGSACRELADATPASAPERARRRARSS